MNKYVFLFLLIFVFSFQISAQTIEYPWRPSSTPSAKLKGAVRTVLTIEQRDERVFSTTVEFYDLNGRLIEMLSSNANIEVHSGRLFRLGGKSIFSYDASGKLIKVRHFEPEGEYTGYTSYIYDSKNRLIEEVGYDTKNKIRNKTTYDYFPEKHMVEATWQVFYDDSKSTPVKNSVSYNDKNQFTKRTELSSKGNDTVGFEYDAKGNFIKEVYCCKYNYSHSYSYKFDMQGNWIERERTYSQLGNNGKEEISVDMNSYRVITYYSDYDTKP
jgi:hypothetical protein